MSVCYQSLCVLLSAPLPAAFFFAYTVLGFGMPRILCIRKLHASAALRTVSAQAAGIGALVSRSAPPLNKRVLCAVVVSFSVVSIQRRNKTKTESTSARGHCLASLHSPRTSALSIPVVCLRHVSFFVHLNARNLKHSVRSSQGQVNAPLRFAPLTSVRNAFLIQRLKCPKNVFFCYNFLT